MKNLKSIKMIAAGVLMVGSLSFLNGCGGISEAQCNELNSLRAKVKTMQDNVEASKAQKAKLENEIAAKNKKLEECNKLKQETKANLNKIGK